VGWIKMEHATPDKHEITALARLLGVSRGDAFLLIVKWWIWLDLNTRNGKVTLNVTPSVTQMYAQDIDNTMHCPGFAMGLAAVGWLEIAADGAVMSTPNFDRHNGETAKSRALNARRQSDYRGNAVTNPSRKSNAVSNANVTLLPLPEKIREEVKNTPSSNVDEGFSEFWLPYPRKVDKKGAHAAWKKLNPDEPLRRRIIAAVLASREGQWKGVDVRYIPHPTTYINRRRWEDELSAPNQEERRYL
jgi:hypothetical protein